MDTLSLTPAIPVRDFSTGGSDLLLAGVMLAMLVLVVAALVLFARRTGPHHRAH